jgi:hypothetical protein
VLVAKKKSKEYVVNFGAETFVKCSLERPGRRREYNIHMDIKEIGNNEDRWTEVAQNCVHW